MRFFVAAPPSTSTSSSSSSPPLPVDLRFVGAVWRTGAAGAPGDPPTGGEALALAPTTASLGPSVCMRGVLGPALPAPGDGGAADGRA